MAWFRKDEPTQTTSTFAMNLFSKDALDRSAIFEQVVREHGGTVLNGRFGGEYNNDQLAIGERDGSTYLWLGLKVTSPSGDLQLDTQSMGPFQQFSRSWLLTVIHALKLDPAQSSHATTIERALADGTLILALIVLTKPEAKLAVMRVELPD